MALLNYSAQYSNISSYLSATSGSIDWLKIFISPDANGGGHFITHGIDFGASYILGQRGLVPNNTGVLTKTFLRGDGWSAFWSSAGETAAAGDGTAAQLAANIESYLQSTLVSAYDIKQWINQSFTANDAMRFKGTISISGQGAITSTTNNSGFPTSCEVGDTYKVNGNTVGESSKIAGQPVSTGDLVVCIKDGSGANLNDAQYWTIVQNNIEHLITYTLNGTAYKLYTQTSTDITLFAPASAGTAGQILVSAGGTNAPTWTNASTLTVGEAAKVTYALIKGSGISMTEQGTAVSSYDGSATITIALNPATTSTIGGVIIDNTANPTVSVDSTGKIYLTQTNIINALGYTPGNSTGSVNKIVVASTASGTANTSAATANPYVNIISDGGSVLGSFQVSGSGNISVNSAASSSKFVVSLGAATDDNYGGFKTGYADNGKNYQVQLSDGKAFVNVPWVSDVFTSSANGLVPMASTANKQTNNTDNVASSTIYLLGEDAKWYKLPTTAFSSTWRSIKVNGTQILSTDTSTNPLDLIAGDHVTLTAGTGNDAGKVTFAAIWRDIQIHAISNGTIGATVTSIGNNDPVVFDNSDSIFTVGETITIGSGANATQKTVIKSYITWYNIDTGEYELV